MAVGGGEQCQRPGAIQSPQRADRNGDPAAVADAGLWPDRGAGLFQASEAVTRKEFRSYVQDINLQEEYAGTLGFGFIQRVPRADLDAFIAAERADDAPDFSVRTSGDPPELYIRKFIEPLPANREALGMDLASDPVRCSAAERAMLTGEPTLSGKVTLVQDSQAHAGFLYLLPV